MVTTPFRDQRTGLCLRCSSGLRNRSILPIAEALEHQPVPLNQGHRRLHVRRAAVRSDLLSSSSRLNSSVSWSSHRNISSKPPGEMISSNRAGVSPAFQKVDAPPPHPPPSLRLDRRPDSKQRQRELKVRSDHARLAC